MARQEGLEPSTYCLEGSCSIQLSYWRNTENTLCFHVERVMGIEPTRPAWKAGILPLNYTRISVFSSFCFAELLFFLNNVLYYITLFSVCQEFFLNFLKFFWFIQSFFSATLCIISRRFRFVKSFFWIFWTFLKFFCFRGLSLSDEYDYIR